MRENGLVSEASLNLVRMRMHAACGKCLKKPEFAVENGKGIEGFDCNEGMLQWIPKKDIFSLNLWEGDQYFLRPLVEGKQNIEMTCVYEGDHLVKYE